ncbi:MAG: multiprotein bridging factor aMBF1 [Promethearchaeota archaeon]
MQCEICGQTIQAPKYVLVEGARLIVCANCARFGSPIKPPFLGPKQKKIKTVKSKTLARRKSVKRPAKEQTGFELVGDFAVRVKTAREKLGWKQEDLGRMIKEKVSTISKIETGKFRPTEKILRKLEKALEIALHESPPIMTEDASIKTHRSHELTLGDVIIVKERKKKST